MNKYIGMIIAGIASIIIVINFVQFFNGEKPFLSNLKSDKNKETLATKDVLVKDGQKIEIDNYVFTLEEQLCEKNTRLGCVVVSVEDKNGKKVNAVIDEVNNELQLLGEGDRFEFSQDEPQPFTKKAEYKGNKLFVTLSFGINKGIKTDEELSHHYRIYDKKGATEQDYKEYNFKLKFSENSRKFESKKGTLYVSPLGLNFVTDSNQDDLVVMLKDNKETVIKNLSNKEMDLKMYENEVDGKKVIEYKNQFEEFIDLDNVEAALIDGEEIK